MSKGYENAQRKKRIGMVVAPLIWVGVLWLLSEWVGKGWFGLEGFWAWFVGALVTVVGIPVLGYLVYLGVVVLLPVVTGKRIDWR